MIEPLENFTPTPPTEAQQNCSAVIAAMVQAERHVHDAMSQLRVAYRGLSAAKAPFDLLGPLAAIGKQLAGLIWPAKAAMGNREVGDEESDCKPTTASATAEPVGGQS